MVTLAEDESEDGPGLESLRSALAGHPQGAIRRIVLYLITTVALAVILVWPDTARGVATIIAMSAVLLLAITDQLT